MKYKHPGTLSLFAVALTFFVTTACGKQESSTVTSANQGTTTDNGCYFGNCGNNGGPNGNSSNGFAYNRNGSGLPILNADDPSGPIAYQTSRYVTAGQTVSINGARGGWGTLKERTSKILFGLLKVYSWSYNCNEINTNGRKDNRDVIFHGAPAGLYASDGATVHLIGTQGVSWKATVSGPILVGFNAPNEAEMCFSTDYVNISIY